MGVESWCSRTVMRAQFDQSLPIQSPPPMPQRLCGEASALVENHDKIRALSLAHLNVAGGWGRGGWGGVGWGRLGSVGVGWGRLGSVGCRLLIQSPLTASLNPPPLET
jgi:hypothetical protein